MARKRLTTNEEWADYLTRALSLNSHDADMLIHDLNNLRADEWIDVIKEQLDDSVLTAFKRFFRISQNP